MARRFERTRRGVTARLDDDEKELITQLVAQVSGMLDAEREPLEDPLEALVGITEGATLPEDPALARLLPDATRDDPEMAAEFRRLTERGLRERKLAALTTARETLQRPGPLVLDADEARAWLVALNDVRLVLSERLHVRTDEDAVALLDRVAGLPPEDPAVWLASVYDFLTWLQETLVTALAAGLGPGRSR